MIHIEMTRERCVEARTEDPVRVTPLQTQSVHRDAARQWAHVCSPSSCVETLLRTWLGEMYVMMSVFACVPYVAFVILSLGRIISGWDRHSPHPLSSSTNSVLKKKCVPDLAVLVVCVAFACVCCRRAWCSSRLCLRAAGDSLPSLLPSPPIYATSHHLN